MIQLKFFNKTGECVGQLEFQSYLDFEYGDSPAAIRNKKFPLATSARITESSVPNLKGIQYDFLPIEELNAQ